MFKEFYIPVCEVSLLSTYYMPSVGLVYTSLNPNTNHVNEVLIFIFPFSWLKMRDQIIKLTWVHTDRCTCMQSCFRHIQLFVTSVQGSLQARTLEWVAMPSSRGSSWPRDRTHIFCLLHWQAGSSPLLPPGNQTDIQGQICTADPKSYVLREEDQVFTPSRWPPWIVNFKPKAK